MFTCSSADKASHCCGYYPPFPVSLCLWACWTDTYWFTLVRHDITAARSSARSVPCPRVFGLKHYEFRLLLNAVKMQRPASNRLTFYVLTQIPQQLLNGLPCNLLTVIFKIHKGLNLMSLVTTWPFNECHCDAKICSMSYVLWPNACTMTETDISLS